MDDNTFIYYLILGAIYLISRALKKKKPATKTTPRPRPTQTIQPQAQQQVRPNPKPQPKRPTSFEEILKELTRELSDEPQQHEIQVEEPKPIEIKPVEEELTREQLYVKKRHAEAERERQIALAKAEEEMKEVHEPHEVLELLREEGGAANAIIFSEILNRKY